MAAVLIKQSDFVGRYSVAVNDYSRQNLQSFIDLYEDRYMIDMLGVDLWNLFKADVVNYAPVTQRFVDLYNAIQLPQNFDYFWFSGYLNWYCRGPVESRSYGVKDMLLGFIYWEYTRKQKFKKTTAGTVANTNENSREVTFQEQNIYDYYNTSVQSYNVIQQYAAINQLTYPEYANAVYKDYAHWSI